MKTTTLKTLKQLQGAGENCHMPALTMCKAERIDLVRPAAAAAMAATAASKHHTLTPQTTATTAQRPLLFLPPFHPQAGQTNQNCPMANKLPLTSRFERLPSVGN
ncbi:conserved hypothetical protein [Trichinella spiralis]|uniref:hypothetical protein n=1 Tax=Trichinella spiralis TaxID=6334 RepID=UPI0001EFBF10|nr:conserved hypothetical protein [Trichinella spiralis]